MASITKRVAAAIQKEFVEGTVFRVDLDRVDIAPNGSTGILRSLPLTGDRDKVKPGDPVRIINVAGERLALVGDVAISGGLEELVEDASEIELAERLSSYSQVSSAGNAEETTTSDTQINDGWVFVERQMTSPNWSWRSLSTTAATAINFVSEFGVPAGTEAVMVRTEVRDSGAWGTPTGQSYYFSLGPDPVNAWSHVTRTFGNDIRNTTMSIVHLDANGNAYYQCASSGTDTLDVFIDVWGYKLPCFEMGSGGKGWIYLNNPITPDGWNGDTFSTVSTRTALHVPTVFPGVPANARAIILRVAAKDSASATYNTAAVGVFNDSTSQWSGCLFARPGGLVNGSWADAQGIVALDNGANFWYTIAASGTGTMSVWFQCYGYLLGEESTAQGWVFLDTPAISANWNGVAVSNTAGAKNTLNIRTEFNVPVEATAVILRLVARDSASAAGTDQYFALYPRMSTTYSPLLVRTNGMPNNVQQEEQGIIQLDPDGNVYWSANASGTNTMTVYIRLCGYLLPTSVTRTTAENLQGYVPKQAATADAHVVVTDGTGEINATGASISTLIGTNTYAGDLNVSSGGNFPWMTRAAINLTGGGTLTCSYYSSAYYIKWTQRFIVIANGRSGYAAPSGYYNVDMPSGGTSIPGSGGAATRTVDATYGIQLGAWEALYYEIPLTASASSVAANFRIVSYTADFVVPANWILICLCNVDTHATYYFPANGGMVLAPATDCDTKRPSQVGINYVVDGGGSVITAGTKGAIVIPASFLVDNVTLLADVSGSVTVNLYYGTYSAYNASMSLFGTYTLASAQKNSIAVGNALIPGDYILRFDVSGVASITRLTISVNGFRGK